MEKIKIGVIGCGYWGPNLVRNFIEIPEASVKGIADIDQDRLDHVKIRYPQIDLVTKDYHDLFSRGLDAIVIATPPQTHFDIARDCLLQDLHILVEKPMTLNSQDARDLVEIANQRNLALMVGHTFVFNPAVTALKEMIDNGSIGEVQYVDAVRVSLGLYNSSLNVIWDLAPHDISILNYILEDHPVKVCTQGSSCIQPGIEDIAYLTLVFPNDILAHIRMSWLDPCKTRKITIVGTKKMLIYDDVESLEKIKIYDKGVEAIRHTNTYGEFQFAYHYGDIVTPYIRLDEPLRLECLHFLDCIRTNNPPLTDGNNGLEIIEIIEAAQISLKNGGGVEPVHYHNKLRVPN